MSWLTRTVQSSIGRKLLVGLSGLGLVGFLIAHLAGNLNMYLGASAMNAYAEKLHHIPGFPLIELGLLVMFVVHIGLVIGLIVSNRNARGTRYAVNGSKRDDRLRALASRAMAFTGVFVLVFIVVHLAQLRLRRGQYDELSEFGVGGVMVDTLSNPGVAALYIIGSLLVGFHIFHGFSSAARSIGVNHPKYTPLIAKLGMVIGIGLGVGFASLPIGVMAGFIDVSGSPIGELVGGDASHEYTADAPLDGETPADESAESH